MKSVKLLIVGLVVSTPLWATAPVLASVPDASAMPVLADEPRFKVCIINGVPKKCEVSPSPVEPP